jgi:hypothetical protein
MKGGSNRNTKRERSVTESTPPIKRQRNVIMHQVDIGGQSLGFVTDKILQDIVNDDRNFPIDTPTIVSLPIPPARHAFMVHILPKYKKIMISDWGTRDIDEIRENLSELDESMLDNIDVRMDNIRNRLKLKNTKKLIEELEELEELESIKALHGWKQYIQFIDLLLVKYRGYTIEFYTVDDDIYVKANEHHTAHSSGVEKSGSGGCSYYIYEWTKRHCKEVDGRNVCS